MKLLKVTSRDGNSLAINPKTIEYIVNNKGTTEIHSTLTQNEYFVVEETFLEVIRRLEEE